ncbi:MAG TPA: menaquinone biosynthesis protein [Puia sp.]|nr:menaquinone biosynthesis protein [Puia sp.]
MDKKIRVGAVSYLNTKPLLYGIQRSSVMNELELIIDYPARIGDMLLRDEIDMGLVPVAVITRMPEYYINGNCGIGSDGPVASVALFSEVPMPEIRQVLLDYQSRTSVQLARLLLARYWKITPELVNAGIDYQEQIRGTTAGVVIGDRAFKQRKVSPYIYDLGEAWKDMTGLPFVFAAWISNKPLDAEFISRFDEANRMGVSQIEQVVQENPYSLFNLHDYFTRYLTYFLTANHRLGLEKFIAALREGLNKEYIAQ